MFENVYHHATDDLHFAQRGLGVSIDSYNVERQPPHWNSSHRCERTSGACLVPEPSIDNASWRLRC